MEGTCEFYPESRMCETRTECSLEISEFSVGAFFKLLQVAEASDRQNIALLDLIKSPDIVNLGCVYVLRWSLKSIELSQI